MQLASAKQAKCLVARSSAKSPHSTIYRLLNKACISFSICSLSTASRVSSYPGHGSPWNNLRPRTPDQYSYPHTRQPCQLWEETNSACCLVLGSRPVGGLHIRVSRFSRVNKFCHNYEQPSIVRYSNFVGEEGRPESSQGSRVNGWDASAWEGRHKYRMTVAYDGTGLAGWQLQSEAVTGQHLVESALGTLTRQTRNELLLVAAGRTDAGVHARGQVVHFWTDAPLLHLAQLLTSLNAILPVSVKVIEVAKVPHLFHARYSAARKTYHYRVHNAAVLDPFKRLYALHVKQKLNVENIRLGAKVFEGEHNFSAFANRSDIKERDPVRTISRFDVVPEEGGFRLEVEGSGFLYKQVRNMVGLLLAIGKGSVSIHEVPKLVQSCDRSLVARLSTTAPPHGLILDSVEYPEHLLHMGGESEIGVRLCGNVEQSIERPEYYEPKNKRVYSVNEFGEVVARVVQDVL